MNILHFISVHLGCTGDEENNQALLLTGAFRVIRISKTVLSNVVLLLFEKFATQSSSTSVRVEMTDIYDGQDINNVNK